MWQSYINATNVSEVLDILAAQAEKVRIIAGGTDLMLEMEQGLHNHVETLVDISRIPDQDKIAIEEDGVIHLGSLVTHNHCLESKLVREFAYPLARACWEVGSPQIRNLGTIAGNLVTASPANDTISPLVALDAKVLLKSKYSQRWVKLKEFYTGVRKTQIHPDEMLVEITFPTMGRDQKGTFIKSALRRAQAISLVNVAVVLTFNSKNDGIIGNAKLAYGAVAPTIIRMPDVEEYLQGKMLEDEVIEEAARIAMAQVKPISDVRSSLEYRKEMVKVITRRALKELSDPNREDPLPAHPILLSTRKNPIIPDNENKIFDKDTPIRTIINGKQIILKTGQMKTLLRLLREDAGLTGTKEGCAEGECGACTVLLDGAAVMSCLVPAPRAHHAEIITIEGVSSNGIIHPVQQSFLDEGAVQCGYCTPGFVMSAVKLLEERPSPSYDEIRHALTGNLCRCTGYYKIIRAIENASEKMKEV